jgi:hypothetical protein
MSTTGLTLFISYAHEDESFRKDLGKHLTALKREGVVEEWHDRMITAGQEWEKQIHTSLDRSHIIILLISPDFMASSYCNEVEVERSMQRYKMGTAKVIPVLVRPADWQGAPFSKLQMVPTDALPVSEWKDRDAAFVDIVKHLRKVCSEIEATPGNSANPYATAKVGDWYQTEVVVDVHQSGETKLASMRMTLVDKNDKQAIVRAEIKSADLGNDEKTMEIPLDRPLEDSMGSIVNNVSGQIPANAIVESRQTGGGSEKLFIGGKTYYTTWVSMAVEIRVGRDRITQTGKRWMSSDIPLDGIVKMVMELPGVYTQTMIVTGYGRGGQGIAAGDLKPNRIPSKPPEQSVTLERVIIGGWNVNISQPFGQSISAVFSFDAQGLFSAEIMSPLYGVIIVQGQWQAQNKMLNLQGVQNIAFISQPYSALVTFHNISSLTLEGKSQLGENVTLTRL